MPYTILVDFGSTFTKTVVLDLENGEKVMTSHYPSTVNTDASIALNANLLEVKKYIGEKGVAQAQIRASSSAAGGLRMIVSGLTPHYSLTAGKNVALGAGARVIKTYSYLLSDDDICQIEKINPEILLLCGGIEGGNGDWVFENAVKLAKSNTLLNPIVYAGNQKIAKEVRAILLRSQKECYVVENVFPSLKEFNAAPAGAVIRNLFMKRIVGMKGLSNVKDMVGDVLMPTPAAVLEGGCLLAEGNLTEPGFGECMVFDVGGATTDVYSFIKNQAGNLKMTGAPEPDHKRTVEGDLGLRSSACSLLDAVNVRQFALSLSENSSRPIEETWILNRCGYRKSHEDYIAENEIERKLDDILAQYAVKISARRHGGRILNAYTKGAGEIQEGKNLNGIRSIIGTGGPIIYNENPCSILLQALRTEREKEMLLPTDARFYLDSSYLLYAIGLAAPLNPSGALYIAKENIEEIG
ncbi:glutamate mutase L [Lachnospiraceae bacterium ZAX-1]